MNRTCPNCQQTIRASAIVDTFNEPDGWEFWGKLGERWIVCRAAGYVHFRVRVNGREQHRLAIIRSQAQAWIETERRAAEKTAQLIKNDEPQPAAPARSNKGDDWL